MACSHCAWQASGLTGMRGCRPVLLWAGSMSLSGTVPCASPTTLNPARLKTQPRQLQSLDALRAVGSGLRGSLVPAASGSGWKREGLRGREGAHTVSRAKAVGVRGAAGCSSGVSVSTSLGVRVRYPKSASLSLEHQLCLQGSGPGRDPGGPVLLGHGQRAGERRLLCPEARLLRGRLAAVTGMRRSCVRASRQPVLLCLQPPCQIRMPVPDGSNQWRCGTCTFLCLASLS